MAVSPPLKSTDTLNTILTRYFQGLDRAWDEGRRVAWCSSIGPCELLVALGFDVYYPENHGAMLGASRMATDLISKAVSAGYSPDICSYLTSDIGAYLQGVTPLTKSYGLKAIPRPDVILFNNNQCREVQDWFMFYAREWDVPIVGIHSPRVLDQVRGSHVRDVTNQLESIIPILEKAANRKFDMDALRETVGLSKACTVRWRKVLEIAAVVPAPMSFFDHCIHMAPAVILRGLPEAVDYYDLLLDELKQRVADNAASVPGERYRFYWDGMPVWGRLRALSTQLMELHSAVVASTYCNSWIFDALDPDNPLESMARAGLECFNVRDEQFKEQYIEDWVRSFQVDGLIFHDAKTCPYNTNSRFAMPARLQEKLNLPTLIINGDLNDLRCFSDEQTRTNLEAFVEQIESLRSSKANVK